MNSQRELSTIQFMLGCLPPRGCRHGWTQTYHVRSFTQRLYHQAANRIENPPSACNPTQHTSRTRRFGFSCHLTLRRPEVHEVARLPNLTKPGCP